VYTADGIADACTFEFTVAIRTAGDPQTDTSYSCPDEGAGCPMTTGVVCALDAAKTTKQKADFIICWDDSQDAKACTTTAGIDSAAFSSCQASSSKVSALKKAAAIKFEAKWPTHAHSGPYHVPHVLANGKDMDSTTYSALIKQLCSSGIKAGACSSVEEAQAVDPCATGTPVTLDGKTYATKVSIVTPAPASATKIIAKNTKVSAKVLGQLKDGKTFWKSQGDFTYSFNATPRRLIVGFDVGSYEMGVGETRMLCIPPEEGYGQVARSGIPANSTLIFTLTCDRVHSQTQEVVVV